MRKKIFSLLLLLVAFLFIHPTNLYASSDFTTSYQVIYTVNPDSSTHAVMHVSLTNTTSDYYASSYKIQVGFQDITNLKASDGGGAIVPVITRESDGNMIGLTFNQHVVGIHKTLNFTIAFDTADVAAKHGQIWEINIPGIANQNDFSAFTVTVQVPKSFGNPIYTKPAQPDNSLTFTKEQLGKSGISLAFGTEQSYDFRLIYHLSNTNVFPIRTEIALPPDTNYQQVLLNTISPKPENVTMDQDGNWMAQYSLLPSKNLDITVKGQTHLSLTPKQTVLTETDRKAYLAERPYWQQSPQIKKLAAQLKTPEAIYDYVVKTLHYDFSRVTNSENRLGAANVLAHPDSAVCLEYTDLFIALARAAAIPAREVDGFAYTENSRERPVSLVKDILHAWPEYYDDVTHTWVMVDPTWGSTTGGVDYFHTMDFDHFAFVVKGVSSEYPVPAGGYKLSSNDNAKDVYVDFSQTLQQPTDQLAITTDAPRSQFPGLPISGIATVANTGSGIIVPQMTIGSHSLRPQMQTIDLPAIPPFGQVSRSFTFAGTPLLTNTSEEFTIQAGNQYITAHVMVSPFAFDPKLILGGIISVLFAFIIFIIARKTRRVLVSRRT